MAEKKAFLSSDEMITVVCVLDTAQIKVKGRRTPRLMRKGETIEVPESVGMEIVKNKKQVLHGFELVKKEEIREAPKFQLPSTEEAQQTADDSKKK